MRHFLYHQASMPVKEIVSTLLMVILIINQFTVISVLLSSTVTIKRLAIEGNCQAPASTSTPPLVTQP